VTGVRAAALLGVLGLAACVVLAVLGGAVMPSYLAVWLFWIALPLGALPLVMALELASPGELATLAALRRVLALLPLAALLAIPVVVRAAALYGHASPARHGYAGDPGWTTPWLLVLRMVVMLAIWTALALVFARPPSRGAPRRGLAIAGLMLHAVLGTVAAVDWVMSLAPGLASSAFGLLLIAAQAGAALSVAILLVALPRTASHEDALVPTRVAALMLALLGMWVFLHFVQFLVVWSADLPAEIVWYQRRDGGLGAAAIWFGLAAAVLALVVLLPRSLARRAGVVAGIAALLLLAHLVEMLWLVTPSFRGHFTISLADVLALAGVGGLVTAFLLASGGHGSPERIGMRHGAA
jgi:hypothetical protein